MKKAIGVIITAAIIAGLLTVPAIAVTRLPASRIPVGTLVIGTHLVYAPAMTNAVYEAALASASDPSLNAQQNSVYYKSEFAGGQWVDISAATNIYDLSAVSGKLVDNSVIDMLTLHFYTMSDGKTYDLTTGRQVAVSDITSPYIAELQTEMKPVVNNLSALDPKNEDNDDAINILKFVLYSNYQDGYTAYLDKAIGSLNSALNSMRSSGASVQKQEPLSKLISTLDHRRRARSLNKMRNRTLHALNLAGGLDLQGVVSTLSPVVDELETKIQEHMAKGGDDSAKGPVGPDDGSGEEADTGAESGTESGAGAGAEAEAGAGAEAGAESGKDKIRAELETKLIDELVSGEPSQESDKLLQELANMDSLDSGAVVSPTEELATALAMIESLSGEIIEKLGGGAIAELVLANPDDPYALRAAEEKQAEIFESARFELQSAIAAAEIRMPAEDYESLISSLIADSRKLAQSIPNDASKEMALQSVQNYMDWLDSEHLDASGESAEKSEAQILQIEINALEEKSKEALDKNDLALSDSLDREIESKSAQLGALEDSISANISAAEASLEKLANEAEIAKLSGNGQLAESLNSQIDSLQSQINSLKADLPADVRAAQGEITRLKQNALEAVDKGNVTDVIAALESLSAFASREPVAAFDAVGKIEGAMLRQEALFNTGTESSGELSAAMEQISGLLPGLREKASAETEVNRISAEIVQAEESIKGLEDEMELAKEQNDNKLMAGIDSTISALSSRVKELEASLPPDALSARKELARLAEEAVKSLKEGGATPLEKIIDSISALAAADPVSALHTAETIDAAIKSEPTSYGVGGAEFGAALELTSQLIPQLSGLASVVGQDLSPKLRELCDSMLEPLPDGLPARIAAVIGLDGGENDKNLLALFEDYYAQLPKSRTFTMTVNKGQRYVPAAVLPYYLNLRFLPEKNDTFLLTNGALYYRFTSGATTAKTDTGSLDMDFPVYRAGTVLYLPESFVESEFGLSVLELPGRRMVAVLVDKDSIQKAAQIVAAMKGE